MNNYEFSATEAKECERNKRADRLIFSVVVIAGFLAVYLYNILTPVMSDDLMFDRGLYQSFGDILAAEYSQYMNWTGRSVLQLLLKLSSLIPLGAFHVINSLFFCALSLLIYVNVKGKRSCDFLLYVLIQLCLWNFSVEFSQTVLWLSGACNYMWGAVIILAFITLYRRLLEDERLQSNKPAAYLVLGALGLLAGWGNENTSGGAILIVILMTGWYYYCHKRVKPWMVAGIGWAGVGFLFLLMAPGNKIRGEMVRAEETYSGLSAYISRGLKVLKAIDEYLLLYIIIICLLGVYFYYKKYQWKQFVEVFIFGIGALATAAVLILTPEPMPRAYYGANIYMLIAVLKMVRLIRKEDTLLLSLKTGAIIAGTVAFIFVYVEEGANLVRILREVNTREEYILKEVEKGESDLTLPMLRPEFASRYSMAHLVDISDDKANWNNELYRNVYRIDRLTVLPWNQWEEYIGMEGQEE